MLAPVPFAVSVSFYVDSQMWGRAELQEQRRTLLFGHWAHISLDAPVQFPLAFLHAFCFW